MDVKRTKWYYELEKYSFKKEMRQAIEQTLDSFFSSRHSRSDSDFEKEEMMFYIASCYCLFVAYSSRDNWKISIELKPIFKDVIKIMKFSSKDDSYIEKALIRYCRVLIQLNQ